MSLEAAATAQEDQLIPGLNFSLGATAAYVTDRKFSSFWPQGSNIYQYNTGQRVLRFQITDPGNGLLDLSTIRLGFILSNLDTTNALLLTGNSPMCLFGRMRVYLGGQLIEDVLNLNRHVGMMMKLLPANRNITQSIEGVGADGGTNGPTSDLIPAGASRNILTPLHGSGFFATHYLIPVGSFGVTVELELCDPAFVAAYQNPTGTNRSQTYSIIQARLLADVVHVDSAIQNQISQALLEGKPLPIHFKTWSNTNHSIDSSGGSWSVKSEPRLQPPGVRVCHLLKPSQDCSEHRGVYQDAISSGAGTPMRRTTSQEIRSVLSSQWAPCSSPTTLSASWATPSASTSSPSASPCTAAWTVYQSHRTSTGATASFWRWT